MPSITCYLGLYQIDSIGSLVVVKLQATWRRWLLQLEELNVLYLPITARCFVGSRVLHVGPTFANVGLWTKTTTTVFCQEERRRTSNSDDSSLGHLPPRPNRPSRSGGPGGLRLG